MARTCETQLLLPAFFKWSSSLRLQSSSCSIHLILQDLGAAGLTKRPTSCMLVLPKPVKGPEPEDAQEYTEAYEDVFKRVKAVQPMY